MTLRITDQEAWSARGDAGRSGHPLGDLRAVVLLAGAVRPSKLIRCCGRSVLNLPVGVGRTVFDGWREQLIALAEALDLDHLPVRVIVSQGSGPVTKTECCGRVEITVEQDPSSFRGTAGLLSDVARGYNDDDQLLISYAGQLLFEPLDGLALGLAGQQADIAIAAGAQNAPSGMILLRCGAVRAVNPVGFVDFNEQALPELAKSHRVKIKTFGAAISRSIRTRGGYLSALRAYHRRADGRHETVGPFAEDWRSTFGIVEPGGEVAEDVIVHDSVVMSGARVGPGAVLVRTVVCPGAVVAAGSRMVDQVVGTERPMKS